MTLAVTHPFVSGKTDGGDATQVQPSNWNAGHTLTGSASLAQGGTGRSDGLNLPKAWVNFDGTGTPAIRSSFNVSSLTDLAVGQWQVNLTAAVADANYCIVLGNGLNSNANQIGNTAHTRTTTSFKIDHRESEVLRDVSFMDAVLFGN